MCLFGTKVEKNWKSIDFYFPLLNDLNITL